MKHLNLTPELYQYLLDVSLREHPVLMQMREAAEKHPLSKMLIAPEQAQFFQLLLQLMQAHTVLELGTYLGYSALAMALALPESGTLITCDINPEYQASATHFWALAHQQQKITQRIGPGLQTMESLLNEGYAERFDFIFIDADKTNYVRYYELALKLLSPKGLIAIDNVFWDGKVIDPEAMDGQTKTIRQLNEQLKSDVRVNISLLPIADGLFLVRKTSAANNHKDIP